MHALLAGAAALLPGAPYYAPEVVRPLLWLVAATSAIHLLMLWGEVTLAHTTAHARLAAHEMTRGQYASFFWAGALLVLAGVAAPVLGSVAALAALAGLLAYEHAHVQAAQSVPLA